MVHWSSMLTVELDARRINIFIHSVEWLMDILFCMDERLL